MPSSEKQAVTRTARGLFSQFNRLEAPPGSQLVADNCVVDRPGILEKRRGFARYGTALSLAGTTGLMKYKRRLLVLDGHVLKYDSDGAGTWVSYSGSFSEPWTGTRMTGVESQQSFYFLTSLGPYKLDTLTSTPTRTGMSPGLDIEMVKTGTGAGWWIPDSQVSYRIIFGRTDANEQEVIGEPSYQEVGINTLSEVSATFSGTVITVTHNAHGFSNDDIIEFSEFSDVTYNGSFKITYIDSNRYSYDTGSSHASLDIKGKAGKAYNTTLTCTLPSDVKAGDFYEVYRTACSGSYITTPGDRHRLVKRRTIEENDTVHDITNKYITFQDTYTDLQEDLYTNPLVETIGKTNSRPPKAKYIASWKGHIWYANTAQAHYKDIQLESITGIVTYPTINYDKIYINYGPISQMFAFSTTENAAFKRFKLYTTEATPSENIRKTMKSFCKIVNLARCGYYAQYISGIDDQAGKVRITSEEIDENPFYLTSTAIAGPLFNPKLPTSGTSISSSNDQKLNGLYHSKFEKPEAVPLSNVDHPGSADYEIMGIQSSKDALIILKEDGYYMMSGDTDGMSGASFILTQLDPTLRVVAPATITSLDNAIYADTSQGIVRTTEAGSKIMSWPIETDLLKVSQIENFNTLAFAIPYESDRKYLIATPARSGNLFCNMIWVYNYITEAWTKWPIDVSAGIVLEDDDGNERLYIAHAEDPYILKERRTYNTADEDYTDWGINTTISATGTTIDLDGDTVSYVDVPWTYNTPIADGWLIETATTKAIVKTSSMVSGSVFRLVLDRQTTFTVSETCTLSMPVIMEVEWMPEYLGNAASVKQYSEAQIYFEREGGIHTMGCCSDTQVTPEMTDQINIVKSYGWGVSPWGSSAWGDSRVGPSSPIRTWVPRAHQRARGLRVLYENHQAQEKISILQMTLTVRNYSQRTQREPR